MTRLFALLALTTTLTGCVLEDEIWDSGDDTAAQDQDKTPRESTWHATAIEMDHDCGEDVELLTPEEFGLWQLSMTGENTFKFDQDGVYLSCVIEGESNLQCTYSENPDDILSGELFDSEHFRLYEIEGQTEDCVEDAYGDLAFLEE